MAREFAKYIVADEAVHEDASTSEDSEPLTVSIETVPRGTEPQEALDRFLARPHGRPGQGLDAVVLDADDWRGDSLVEWVRRFHEAYLARQVEAAPGAWVNALHPVRLPVAVPPALVVVTSPGLVNEGLQHRISAAGALVYEKPPAVSFEDSEKVAAWLRQELTEPLRLMPDVRGFSPASQELGTGPFDLAAYVDPVYRLRDEDFEDLLRRSRIEDPLEVGE